MLSTMRAVQTTLHADENLLAEQPGARCIPGEAGQVTGNGRLVASDERSERPIRSHTGLICKVQFLFIFGVYSRCRACKHVLPGHINVSSPVGNVREHNYYY
jgi:hypothetical protein